MAVTNILVELPVGYPDAPLVLLAHGAGAPMDSDFMEHMTALLRAGGVGVARFEFQYMAMRRHTATRRPPPKAASLAAEYRAVLSTLRARHPEALILIGGKSMGGRIASMIADEAFTAGSISACVCLGYPFHPARQPETVRTAHLTELACPALIVQGERDALGNRRDVAGYRLSPALSIAWITDGDHDLSPRKKSGLTHADNLVAAAAAITQFVMSAKPSRTSRR